MGDHSFSVETVEPVALGEDEVRVDVAYCGICGTDMHVYYGAMDARVGDHRVIGHEMSGTVAALVEPVAVACHAVRRSRLVAGEDVLVIGGGPIGMLIAMVARNVGAKVTLSEVNPNRLELAQSLGFATLDPTQVDVAKAFYEASGGKGADVIFEVSGTEASVDTMTEAAAARCRIVMVAIQSQKPQVDLFKFFWRS